MTQLANFIESNAKFQSTQHGFRKSHSTVTCLLKIRDDIFRAMDKVKLPSACLQTIQRLLTPLITKL